MLDHIIPELCARIQDSIAAVDPASRGVNPEELTEARQRKLFQLLHSKHVLPLGFLKDHVPLFELTMACLAETIGLPITSKAVADWCKAIVEIAKRSPTPNLDLMAVIAFGKTYQYAYDNRNSEDEDANCHILYPQVLVELEEALPVPPLADLPINTPDTRPIQIDRNDRPWTRQDGASPEKCEYLIAHDCELWALATSKLVTPTFFSLHVLPHTLKELKESLEAEAIAHAGDADAKDDTELAANRDAGASVQRLVMTSQTATAGGVSNAGLRQPQQQSPSEQAAAAALASGVLQESTNNLSCGIPSRVGRI